MVRSFPNAPACALMLGIALLAAPPLAHAQQPSAPSAEARREAGREYAEGTRAFDAGDYTRAAQKFESAYALATHEDALWNAARAWHRAGELARAANFYAHYLRDAPPNAADRTSATSELKTLSAKLGRIEVHVSSGVEQARIDDAPITAPAVYVVAGTHVIRATSARGPIEQQHAVKEGEVISVVLAPPASSGNDPPVVAPAPPPRTDLRTSVDRDTTSPRKGWSPTVVWIGGGLTLVAAGLTTWSAFDTLAKLDDFEAAPTQEKLEDGRSKEIRTNVLLGTSIGLAAITGAIALLLVDWRGSEPRAGLRAAVHSGMGSAMLSGSF